MGATSSPQYDVSAPACMRPLILTFDEASEMSMTILTSAAVRGEEEVSRIPAEPEAAGLPAGV